MSQPKWLSRGEEPSRKRADKYDQKFAKKHGGRTYCNSGAKFGQNDVKIGDYDFETKYTDNKQYPLKAEEFRQIQRKAGISKIAVEVIRFPKEGMELAVIDLETLMGLIEKEKELAALLAKT